MSMKKRIQKKFTQVYNHETTLIDRQHCDRWDVKNDIDELNFYLNKTQKLSKKMHILRNAIKFDSKNLKRRQTCNL